MKANEVSFFCTRVMDRLIVVTDGGKGVFGDIQQAQTHPPRSSLSLYKHDGHESTPETYIETCSSIGLPPLYCQGQLRFHESFDRTDRTTSYEAIVAQEICFAFLVPSWQRLLRTHFRPIVQKSGQSKCGTTEENSINGTWKMRRSFLSIIIY